MKQFLRHMTAEQKGGLEMCWQAPGWVCYHGKDDGDQ